MIDGQKITGLYTLGSWYDNDSVGIRTSNGKSYRLKSSEILKMVNEFTFDVKKARTREYLINPKLKES